MKNHITLSIIFFCLQLFSQQTIETKFAIPDGYEREIISEFHQWIINQPLKDDNKVFYSEYGTAVYIF